MTSLLTQEYRPVSSLATKRRKDRWFVIAMLSPYLALLLFFGVAPVVYALCTNPGIAVVIDGPDEDAFQTVAEAARRAAGEQTMLTDGIADAYRKGTTRIAEGTGGRQVIGMSCYTRPAAACPFTASGDDWLADEALQEEVFGPLGIVARVRGYPGGELLVVATNTTGPGSALDYP
ncbi:hypothetical protein [Hoeflea sp.]|uniref:hypothetical protein n=1 Tax=Hoeflea sp. TaxID=1940281 RepID=UPI003B01F633